MQVFPSTSCLYDSTAYHVITIPQNINTNQRYAWLSMTDQCNQTYTRLVGYHACGSGYSSFAARAYPNPANTVLNIVYGTEAQAEEQLSVQALYLQYKQSHPNEIITPPDATILQQSRTTDYTGTINIKLYNALGQALIDITKPISTNSTALDVSKIPNGIYFLHLTENGQTQKSQLIIQH